uniref:DUF4371 domain-containing protein n=1 Tax=Ciona intestinalis TaxID=7719 RepID=F6X4E3_CIOIN
GFNDWRKGRAAIRKHGSSEIHRECVSAKLNDSSRAADLVTDISVSKMKENRIALNALFDAICFLGRQGLALRGHTEENSNLVQSLKLLGKYNDTVKNWISRKTRFLSAEIQNEILESLALRVLRHEIHQVKAARLFSIISDETADVSNKEQVCICIRYVDDKFIIHESFIGLFETCETSSATLHKLIQSAITSVGLSFNDCRGQSYDGAANMSGHLSGVQARFKEMYPAMLYVHCSGHNLNLAIQDTFRNNTDAANSLATLNGVVNFIKASPKRLSMFENFRYSALRPLCPTRWAMRFEAIDIFIKNYDTILNWLQTVATDSSMDGKSRSGARSFLLSLEKFSIFYCLNVMHMLLEKIQPAHRAIQSRSINIGRCYQLIENLALSFTECLNTTEKSTFFKKCALSALKLGIGLPSVPRGVARRSAAINEADGSGDDASSYYANLFGVIVQSAVDSLQSRFCQGDIETAKYLEDVLLSAIVESKPTPNLERISNLYNFEPSCVKSEISTLTLFLRAKNKSCSSINELICVLLGDSTLRLLLPNISGLVQLYLTLPCTSCEAERAFSCLKRVKSYLRSTMAQRRLNHACLLNIYKEHCDILDKSNIINEWISRTATRKNTF